ncbi:hypothetical protein NPIL_271931 [Nephila pilipes]|uniref:Secreted protein n=1 Tax=Nephila pilipes TaxID=299642 RepID=A0A8X6P3M1_NEPPI|nr:hypothetical protein NPIL_271931 [Nephila pilipes]
MRRLCTLPFLLISPADARHNCCTTRFCTDAVFSLFIHLLSGDAHPHPRVVGRCRSPGTRHHNIFFNSHSSTVEVSEYKNTDFNFTSVVNHFGWGGNAGVYETDSVFAFSLSNEQPAFTDFCGLVQVFEIVHYLSLHFRKKKCRMVGNT